MKYTELDRSLRTAKYHYNHSKDKGAERQCMLEVQGEVNTILSNLR